VCSRDDACAIFGETSGLPFMNDEGGVSTGAEDEGELGLGGGDDVSAEEDESRRNMALEPFPFVLAMFVCSLNFFLEEKGYEVLWRK